MTHVVNLIVPKYHLSFTWKLIATKQIDQIMNREFLVRNYTLHKVERWGHLKLYSVAMCTVKGLISLLHCIYTEESDARIVGDWKRNFVIFFRKS